MNLNVFEGARRIAKLFGGLFVAGCLAFGAFNKPYYSIEYRVTGLGESREISSICEAADAYEYETVLTPNGDVVPVRFCFPAVAFDGGESLIPYAPEENGRWLVGGKYSTKVREYTRAYASQYRFDDEGLRAVAEAKKLAYLAQWQVVGQVALGGLAFLWCFTWAIGWIVRGFLGVPRGQDSK